MTEHSDKPAERPPSVATAQYMTLSGRVTRDSDGSPVVDATIHVQKASALHGELSSATPMIAETTPDGHWSINGITSGEYIISVSAAGLLPSSRRSYVSIDNVPTLDFQLHSGGTTLTGIVATIDGAPIGQAFVKAQSDVPDSESFTATTQLDGKYAITLHAGAYDIVISHPDFVSETRTILIGEDTVAEDFSLLPGAVVSGRVVARDTGDVIVGAVVQASGCIVARSGPDGSFVARRLDSGESTFEAYAPGYASTDPVIVDLDVGEHLRGVEIVLDPAVMIAGRTSRAEDAAESIPGVAIVVQEGSSDHGAFALSDAAGRFTIPVTTEGPYTIFARKDGFLSTVTYVKSFTSEHIRIQMSEGLTLSGHVTPPQVAAIRLAFESDSRANDSLDIENAMNVRSRSKMDGAFVLRNVPSGTFTISALASNGYAGKLTIHISDTSLSGLLIPMTSHASMAGIVRDANGTPQEGVKVHSVLRRPHDSPMKTVIDPNRLGTTTLRDGTFILLGLEPGEHRLWATDALGRTVSQDLILAPGERRDGVLISIKGRDGVIRGDVLDANRNAVPKAWVTAFHLSGTTPLRSERVLTDASGRFLIKNLFPGKHLITAEVKRGVGSKTGVETGEAITIVLTPFGTLDVKVRQNGNLVSDFAISCTSALTSRTATTPNGSITFERLLPGQYECMVQASVGMRKLLVDVTEARTEVNVDLERWATLTGTIVDSRSADPIPGMLIVVSNDIYETDRSGRFVVDRAPPGTGTLMMRSPDNVRLWIGTHTYTARAGETLDLGVIRALQFPGR